MKKRLLYFFSVLCLLTVALGLVCCKKTEKSLESPQNVRVERRVLYWDEVENATGYDVSVDGEIHKTDENRMELYTYMVEGEYDVKVRAVDVDGKYTGSDWAKIQVVLTEVLEEGYDEKGYKYTLLEDRTGYEISRGNAKLEGVLELPDYFGDYPVTSIAKNGFRMGTKVPQWHHESKAFCNTTVTGLRFPAYLKIIKQAAFIGFLGLQELVIPDSVTELEGAAFKYCTNLKQVSLSKNLKIIKDGCFATTALEELVLPDSLEEIGNCAFESQDAKIFTNSGEVFIHLESELSSVTIPASVKKIGGRAFHNRENLASVTFLGKAEDMEEVGDKIFHDTKWYEMQPDGLIYVQEGAVYGYKGSMPENYHLEIPAGVKTIWDHAFEYQNNLQKVTLPHGIKMVGNAQFMHCFALIEVILPDDLQKISSSMFAGDDNLTTITLPKNVKEIQRLAFNGTAVETIIIPASVERLGWQVFMGSIIKTVYFEGDEAAWKTLYEQETGRMDFDAITVYTYSEEQPQTAGNYWHYANGMPILW